MPRKPYHSSKDDDFDFSTVTYDTTPSFQKRANYFVFALLISVAPLWLYYSVFSLSFQSFAPIYALVTLLSAGALTTAYHNGFLWLKNKLTNIRENAIKPNKQRRDENKSKKAVTDQKAQQAAATEEEATAFSILYTDLFFLFSVLIFAFYVFRAAQPAYNYVLSIGASTLLVTFVSSATLNS